MNYFGMGLNLHNTTMSDYRGFGIVIRLESLSSRFFFL